MRASFGSVAGSRRVFLHRLSLLKYLAFVSPLTVTTQAQEGRRQWDYTRKYIGKHSAPACVSRTKNTAFILPLLLSSFPLTFHCLHRLILSYLAIDCITEHITSCQRFSPRLFNLYAPLVASSAQSFASLASLPTQPAPVPYTRVLIFCFSISNSPHCSVLFMSCPPVCFSRHVACMCPSLLTCLFADSESPTHPPSSLRLTCLPSHSTNQPR